MTRKIFGITGLKGSGKDTLGDAISGHLNRGHRFNFADPLKQICKIAFGLTHDEMHDPMWKEATVDRWPYKSPRTILQHVGTELFRDHYPGIWVRNWLRLVESTVGVVICTDYRFPDEAEALRSVGAVLIRVVRPEVKSDGHASEQVDNLPADIEIMNVSLSAGDFGEYAVFKLIEAGHLEAKS